jgi:biopolymer transport protein ExbB
MEAIQWAVKFMQEGGIFMWIILGCWCLGVAIAFERYINYARYDIDGRSLMASVRKHVIENKVPEAIQSCSQSKALLSFVLKNGLKRANHPKEHIQDSLEASILEVVPYVGKRLNYLSLLSNLSTLLGLLGTIQGLIQSFAAVAKADASDKAQLLADGIAVAMNTTALGLLSAITLMVIHSFLSNKGEKILHEIEENSVKLIELLNTKKAGIVDKAA